jgi:hypothetical protein
MWNVRNLGDDLEQLTRDVELHDKSIGGLGGLDYSGSLTSEQVRQLVT